MKIVYVVPGPMDLKEMDRRGEVLKKWAFNETDVDIVRVLEGPRSIESKYEEYLSIPSTSAKVFEMEKEGYDAAILGCAGDPGLDGMREITQNMLVVGPAETGLLTSAMLGRRISVLTVDPGAVSVFEELGYKAGIEDKLVSVHSVDIPVLELRQDRDGTIARMKDLGEKVMAEDKADVFVLGCMSMGFLEMEAELSEALGVPVINPARVALKMSEGLVSANLIHSPKAYLTPAKISSGRVQSLSELYVKVNE